MKKDQLTTADFRINVRGASSQAFCKRGSKVTVLAAAGDPLLYVMHSLRVISPCAYATGANNDTVLIHGSTLHIHSKRDKVQPTPNRAPRTVATQANEHQHLRAATIDDLTDRSIHGASCRSGCVAMEVADNSVRDPERTGERTEGGREEASKAEVQAHMTVDMTQRIRKQLQQQGTQSWHTRARRYSCTPHRH